MMKYLQKVLLILITLMLTAVTGSASAEVTYFHHDAQGSTIAATSDTGAVLWRESYEPYGERLDKAVSTNDHATYYTGKPHDDRTGLTYFGARHYDPVVGRFMGIDPVGVNPNDPRTFNRYAYAANNPYKFVDPDGRAIMFAPAIIPFLGGSTAAGGATAAGSSTAGLIGGLLGIGIGTGGWLWYNNDNANNDPVDDVLVGASPGDETKGRTANWDKPGGMDQADNDFDKLVPNGAKPIDDSGDRSRGRKGVMEDGRKVNVRPNSSDGRPTLEIQNGKNRTKVRYND
ncbi:MAG: RHS repeat-associated core domain-containing protein [Candidatus Thiodiazotropha sp. LLP2]